jgi:hypothetical protein
MLPYHSFEDSKVHSDHVLPTNSEWIVARQKWLGRDSVCSMTDEALWSMVPLSKLGVRKFILSGLIDALKEGLVSGPCS